jgi:two-component system response regulator WspF
MPHGISDARSVVPAPTPPRAGASGVASSQAPAFAAGSPIPPIVVAIGASTGGPRAIADLLRSLPKDLPAAFLLVQHVSVEFVAGFAQWLAAETGRRVALARAGDVPRTGEVLVAGADRHLGAEGMLALRRAGWHTIAQDEATSVVWGMPGVAHRTGAAVETLPLGAIGDAVQHAVQRAGSGRI